MSNVIVAFPKEESNQKLKSILMQCGYHVSCCCSSGNHVLNRALELRYGIVLTGYRMKDMIWDELRNLLPGGFQVVLLLSEAQAERIGQLPAGTNYVTVPFVVGDLLEAVKTASASADTIRYRDKNRPRKRTSQELAEIKEAKELLMEQRHMTEAAAHRYLQRRSMESQVSLTECAQKVIRMLKA